MTSKLKQNYINHIEFDIDCSGSMYPLSDTVVKVFDNQIKYLAESSTRFDQETRVTVYTFNHEVQCVIYEKDVLRLPSLRDFYYASGRTALIDATMQGIEDHRMIPQKYGNHAFLKYVITDGQENESRKYKPDQLLYTLNNLADNETVAVLVPDQTAVFMCQRYGFPTQNIAVWDSNSAKGLEDAVELIRASTDSFMVSRAAGVRSTRTLFSTGTDAVNKKTVKAAKLTPLDRNTYTMFDVDSASPIREWVQGKGYPYLIGKAFYQMTKTESIQPQKQVAVQNIHSGRIYTGPQARELLGLPDMEVRVRPSDNPEYRVFIQSTSVNRKLVPKTKLLLLK